MSFDVSNARLRRLIEAMPEVISELELEKLMERVLALACEITDARYAAVGVLDEDRHELERFLTRGIDPETHARIGDLPRGRGVLGVLIEDPVPLRLADVGSHPSSYGFPPGHPPMTTFLGVPIMVRGEAWGNLYLTERQAGEFTAADEEAAVLLASWVAIAVENARLYERERRRAAEMEQAVRGMRATTDIARAVGGETELERVLELIVKRGRALVHAGVLMIALRDGDVLDVRAAAGRFRPQLVEARIPVGESVAGNVLRTKRSQRLSDVGSQLRFALSDWIDAEAGLLVPLVFRGRAVGVLYAFDRQVEGPEFSRDDELLLESFAASAATAVATAQEFMAHGLRRSIEASERERRRWARELHDQTLQDMAALRVLLSSARRRGTPEALAAAVDDAVERLGEGIDELRAIITDLRPAALDELGTKAAIEALVERLAGAPGAPRIELHLDLDYEAGRCPDRHEPTIENTLYRLVQEATTNAVKHAAARLIEISVVERDGSIEAHVRDDGEGFDPDQRADGFGLIGIRERLALVGGTVEVTSRPGEGTEIAATIPSSRAAAGIAAAS
jgi:signal transduction histidine kinase